MSRCATTAGTLLTPGVSRNGRLYTAPMIKAAVREMQTRLSDPAGLPLTMLTHHGAGDDSAQIVGRLTNVDYQGDGSATFEADIADTPAGQTIAALVTGDTPFLRSVSIRGAWLGEPREVSHNGQTVTTADGLAIFGVDFTKDPGVEGARITSAALAETLMADVPHALTESLEGVLLVSETILAPVYADRGYLGQPALPVTTPTETRSSWGAVHLSEGYTPNQLKRVKQRIREAAKKHNVDIVAEHATAVANVTEAIEEMQEAYASLSLDTGSADLRISGWVVDAADLPTVARKLAAAALAGLAILDPDGDGDIDLTPETDAGAPPVVEHESTPKEPSMTEQAKPVPTIDAPKVDETKPAETAPVSFTQEQFDAKLAEALAEAAAPKAKPEPTLAETIAAEVAKAKDAIVKETTDSVRAQVLAAYGQPSRKGMVVVGENAETPSAADLAKLSDAEFRDVTAKAWQDSGAF